MTRLAWETPGERPGGGRRQSSSRRRREAEAAKRNPATYAKISARNFAKVAKNPDNFVGKKYLIYGYVKRGDWHEYQTNSAVDDFESRATTTAEPPA